MHKRSNVVAGEDVEPVDLTAPSRAVRGRLPAIGAIQDRLSRQLRLDLFRYLHYGVQITDASTRFEAHDDVVRRLEPPTMIAVAAMPPLRGLSVISVDGALIGAVVDRLCGADVATATERSADLSALEVRIGRRLLDVMCDSIRYAWQAITDIRVDIARIEYNAAFVAVADAQEPLITTRVRIKLATGEGNLVVAVPYAAIEPFRERLSTSAVAAEVREEDKREWRAQMHRTLSRISMPLRVEIARVDLSGKQVKELAPGQIISLRELRSAQVYCGGTRLFDAEFGLRDGAAAIRVGRFTGLDMAAPEPAERALPRSGEVAASNTSGTGAGANNG